ncbi:hypothetical protein ACFL0R_03285, partial [Pseudomonadota bacterium]
MIRQINKIKELPFVARMLHASLLLALLAVISFPVCLPAQAGASSWPMFLGGPSRDSQMEA